VHLIFLNSAILVAALFVAVPVLLHLWRRKPVPVVFPALQFLKQRHQVTRRKLRLRELLLLALRVLAVLCLVGAFARPVWAPEGWEKSSSGNPPVVLVFDTSARMDYVHQGESRLERARRWGQELLPRIPAGAQIAVVDGQGGPIGFEADRAAALVRLRKLTISPGAMPVAASVLRGLELLQGSNTGGGELFVFTDLAEPGWPSEMLRTLREQLATMPTAKLWLVDVGVEEPVNFALGDLQVVSSVTAPGSSVYVRTFLTGTVAGQKMVELRLQEPQKPEAADNRGEYQLRGAQTVSVLPGQPVPVEFSFTVSRAGIYQGFLALLGEDPLKWDDRRFFTVVVRPPENVLLVAPQQVLPNLVYLREMLAPEALAKLGRARFRCHQAEQSQLEETPLEKFAVLVLVDPQPLEDSAVSRLVEYVRLGGGLAIFLGASAGDPQKWDTAGLQQLLPAVPIRQARVPEGTVLRPDSFHHPILQPLEPHAEKLPWDLAPVYRYWQVNIRTQETFAILNFATGEPAILERKVGQGRVLLITSPISDPPRTGAWNLWTSGDCWPLLALVHQMMVYGGGVENIQVGFSSTPRLSVLLPGEPPRPVRIVPSVGWGSDSPVVLEQKDRFIQVQGWDLTGNYLIPLEATSGSSMHGFSVNIPSEATVLTRKAEELLQSLGTDQVRLGRSLAEFDLRWASGGQQRELSGWLLFLAVLFFLGEFFLSNQFYTSRYPADSAAGAPRQEFKHSA
jgi:hypothetical protein